MDPEIYKFRSMIRASSRPGFWTGLAFASLVVNLGLVIALSRGNKRPRQTERPPLITGSSAAAAQSTPTWRSRDDDPLLELCVRLRQAGFPVPVVREILLARIAELPPTDRIGARLALEQENRRLTDELLRAHSEESTGLTPETLFRRRFGDLSEEKAGRLKRLLADYDELRKKLRNSPSSAALSIHAPEYQLLEKEQEADIARLLSLDELFEYELRSSETARQMRMLLPNFEVTETEFRALFPLFRELGFQGPIVPSGTLVTAALREQWRIVADPVFQSKIEQTLGPRRAEDFRRATAPAIRSTGRPGSR